MRPQTTKLDKQKVAEARREEMKYFETVGVYKKVPHAQAIERTGRRPVGIKWVDVKKADRRHRSRLVATEFNNGINQAMYAATPPSGALKLLTVNLAAREGERRDTKIAPGDDNNAQAQPNTYVQVPGEDQSDGGKVCQGDKRSEAGCIGVEG